MRKTKNRIYVCFKCFLVVFWLIFYSLNSITVQAESIEKLSSKSHVPKKNTFSLVPLLLEIKLNESLLADIAHVYQDASGHIWVETRTFRNWGMSLPTRKPMLYQSHELCQLDWYPGVTYQFNPYAMQLSLHVPAGLFTSQSFDPRGKILGALRPNDPGAFLNYDIIGLRTQHNASQQTHVSALMGLGLFNRLGVGTTDILAYNRYVNDVSLLANPSDRLVRLNTTWTLDEPEKIASWRIGDAVTGSTYWSGAARFAGIQYATNFNTQPYLVTFPLPGYAGEASIPSAVNIFVNSALHQKQMINSGPYVFNNIPVISGAGTVSVVTQDILGRSQTINFPYYASPLLLKPNLVNFSYEAGFMRANYAIRSNDYRHFLSMATYYRGVTKHLTLGGHAEILRQQQTLGFSANYLFHQFGVASMAVSGAHNFLGQGGLLALGFVRQSTPFSYGFHTRITSANYLQIGDRFPRSAPRVVNQIFWGSSFADYGSLSASYSMINNRNFNTTKGFYRTPTVRLVTVSFTHNLLKHISMRLGFVKNLRHSKSNQFFLSLIFAPDVQHTVSHLTSWHGHRLQSALQFSRPLPLGTGYGYNLFTSNNSDRYVGGDFTLQNQVGSYAVRLEQGHRFTNYELDVSGGVVYFADQGFLTPKLTSSFALVQVPDFPNVRVFYEHQHMGRTNTKGNLLITRLLPYHENNIAIELSSVPLDAQITATTQTAIPYFSSGILVKFPVKRIQGVLMHVQAPNHQLIPVGSELVLHKGNDGEVYPVGYDGEVYIPNVRSLAMLGGTVHSNNRTYHFFIKLPKTNDPIIELGTVRCY